MKSYLHTISGLRDSNLAAYIIKNEWVSLSVNDNAFPKHLIHHYVVVAFCVGNVICKLIEQPLHPARNELLSMYFSILDEMMGVLLRPDSKERFNLSEHDEALLDSIIGNVSHYEESDLIGH